MVTLYCWLQLQLAPHNSDIASGDLYRLNIHVFLYAAINAYYVTAKLN